MRQVTLYERLSMFGIWCRIGQVLLYVHNFAMIVCTIWDVGNLATCNTLTEDMHLLCDILCFN